MRVLVISDIHANLAAFEAVLDDASGQWDTIWCLGDVIGYGPDPEECVTLLRQHSHVSLSGNHDWAVLGKLDVSVFNHEAQAALLWTRSAISDETCNYLDALPTTIVSAPFTLAHASPRQPIWEYILDIHTATANFAYFDTPFCLVGHTHVPVGFFEQEGTHVILPVSPDYRAPIALNGMRRILNPGSVGQPRDSDPRAAYALLDTEGMTWQYRRIAYPISLTQQRMFDHGISVRLAKRLEFGW
jgi:diadenosine tetraphosphatase ApaH/serine/threonine PP2A family protein phosphatase